jgi:hypothetical protein
VLAIHRPFFMQRTTRLTLGLLTFTAIQAGSVILLAAAWRSQPEIPSNSTLFALLGLHFMAVLVAGAAAALIWGGAPPSDPPTTGPPGPPPPFSPAALPVGPRRPAPLEAHAVPPVTHAA